MGENEVDYDEGPTQLFTFIQKEKWEEAAAAAMKDPLQIRTWVYRNEKDTAKTLRWRLLPIHATCVFKAPESFVELLLDNYPQAATLPDDQGMLPIHLACRNGASKAVARMLLEIYPESLTVLDRKRRTPMDLVQASKHFHKESVILTLKRFSKVAATLSTVESTTADSESSASSDVKEKDAVEVNYENRTVLLRHIMKKDWNKALVRCKEHPEEAATWINTKGLNGDIRFLPIHKALVHHPPKSLIDELLVAYPDGAKCKDQDNWLPIHCACFYKANEEVIKALITAYPKGVKAAEDEGQIPLHFACLRGGSLVHIGPLLDEYPKGAQHKDNEGRIPIHIACSKGSPVEVIKSLCKAYTKGPQTKNSQSMLPLHLVCQNSVSEGAVKFLLKIFPQGSKLKDDQGKLPMHYAVENPKKKAVIDGSSLHVIQALWKESAKALQTKDDKGMIPLHYACQKNISESIVKFLLKTHPQGAKAQDDHEKLPLHYACANPNAMNSVRMLLEAHPTAVNVKDEFSNTPLMIAKEVKKGLNPVVKTLNAASLDVSEDGENVGDQSNTHEKELMARIAALEMTVISFTQATKDMQESLAEGENAKDVLENFTSKVDTGNILL